jgi:hypothetical protein
VVLAYSSVRCHLIEEEDLRRASAVTLTATEIDETEPSGLPNQTVQFSYFMQELLTPCLICVTTKVYLSIYP